LSDSNVHVVQCLYDSAEGYKESNILASDIHWDDKDCNRTLLKEHLEKAKSEQMGVFVFGDLFDVMQGPGDPRASKPGTRLEHLEDSYFDEVVESAIEWFAPYSEQLRVVGYGNHETAVIKHYGTDLIARFVNGINERHGGTVAKGGYEGWVVWQFGQQCRGGVSHRKSVKLYYNHGSSGGGVTKGTTKAPRRASYLPDANIVYGGHIHEAWEVEIPRLRLSSQGVVSTDIQHHLQGPAYTNDRRGGLSWAVTKEFAPKPVGCWQVDMTIRNAVPVISPTRLR
jgi:hypothetical protein